MVSDTARNTIKEIPSIMAVFGILIISSGAFSFFSFLGFFSFFFLDVFSFFFFGFFSFLFFSFTFFCLLFVSFAESISESSSSLYSSPLILSNPYNDFCSSLLFSGSSSPISPNRPSSPRPASSSSTLLSIDFSSIVHVAMPLQEIRQFFKN